MTECKWEWDGSAFAEPNYSPKANGAPGRTRTFNLSLRKGLLYPIELQGHLRYDYTSVGV